MKKKESNANTVQQERDAILFPALTPDMKRAFELGYYASVILPYPDGRKYAVWTKGNDTALPTVDLVGLGEVEFGPEGGTCTLLGLVPWDTIQNWLGPKMVFQHERYYVDAAHFPSDADIERMRIDDPYLNGDMATNETYTALARGINVLTSQRVVRPVQFGIRTDLAKGPREQTVVEASCWDIAREWADQGILFLSVEVFRGAYEFNPSNVERLTKELQPQFAYGWANEMAETLFDHFSGTRTARHAN